MTTTPKPSLLHRLLRRDLLPPGLYVGAAFFALLAGAVLALRSRWGIAKAGALVVVGVAYLTVAQGMRQAQRANSVQARTTALRARAVANAGWLAVIVLWVLERATR